MLWSKKTLKGPPLAVLAMVGALALAGSGPVLAEEETFEKAGVIESVNLVARTVVLDGTELTVLESLMTTYNGRREPFLSLIVSGGVVSLSGRGSGEGPSSVITSVYIHELPADGQ